ncbi:MAG: hypothetical protein GXX96_11350 [Planctomycetaceae bacterium]|nr:hypothetical protein [Planctomycetaceae bacterium]
MGRFLTTREVGDIYQEPEWRIRRIVDRLEPPVSRFGQKRMIPADRLGEIAERLREKADAS